MNLSDQVCSLELSKRLKELLVKQESLFCYQDIKDEKPSAWPRKFNLDEFSHPSKDERMAAFTASELGEMLPNSIQKPDKAPFDNYRLVIRKFILVNQDMEHINNFVINYECDSTEMSGADAWLTRKVFVNIYDSNLANAMAKMLIKLIENGLTKND